MSALHHYTVSREMISHWKNLKKSCVDGMPRDAERRVELEEATMHKPENRFGSEDRVLGTVLAVSPFDDDHAALQRFLSVEEFRVEPACTLTAALDRLRETRFPVVIAECDLGGEHCWKDLLNGLKAGAGRPAPRLVVASRLADHLLWAEVLNLGAFDLLAKPFEEREVQWVVSSALYDWSRELSAGANGATGTAAARIG